MIRRIVFSVFCLIMFCNTETLLLFTTEVRNVKKEKKKLAMFDRKFVKHKTLNLAISRSCFNKQSKAR